MEQTDKQLVPPVAKKVEKTFEMHGQTFTDNYAWMREKKDQEIIDHLNKENAYTKQQTKHLEKFEEGLFQEMKSRIKEDDETVPFQIGNYFYNSQTIKDKDYRVHKRYHKDTPEKIEVIYDENKEAEGFKFFDLMDYNVSPNGKIMAFATDTVGDEKFKLKFRNLETGEQYKEEIEIGWSFEWATDNVIYYTITDKTQRCYAIKKHTLGQTAEEDKLVFQEDDDKRSVYIWKSNGGKYMYHSASSKESKESHYLDLTLPEPEQKFEVFLPRIPKHEYSIIDKDGFFYIVTNSGDATNFKVMRTQIGKNAQENWEEIIPHNIKKRINALSTFKDFLVVSYREDGLKHLDIFYGKDDPRNHRIPTPENVYSMYSSFNEVYDTKFFRFKYSSLKTPMTVYDYFVEEKKLEQRKQNEVFNYDPKDYESERRFIKVRDGTMVPISLVYKKGIQFPAPTIQYGYGSYGYSIDADFNSNRISLLQRGVAFIIAHIRGGGEMGKEWQNNGKYLKKKNTFYDFIDVTKYLHQEKITTKELTTIMGGSAGGLLMGAVANEEPSLYNLVVADVPFVDVINTMLDSSIPLTTSEYEEWGNPNEKEYFDYMLSYSPYDQVKKQDYPKFMILGGLNDTRVHYWEPSKWTAKLRELKTDNNQLLLRMEMNQGHMGASGRYEFMKERAFLFSYVLDQYQLAK